MARKKATLEQKETWLKRMNFPKAIEQLKQMTFGEQEETFRIIATKEIKERNKRNAKRKKTKNR